MLAFSAFPAEGFRRLLSKLVGLPFLRSKLLETMCHLEGMVNFFCGAKSGYDRVYVVSEYEPESVLSSFNPFLSDPNGPPPLQLSWMSLRLRLYDSCVWSSRGGAGVVI
jgi:hypothetical protein